MRIIHQLEHLKHNGTKSCIAIDMWIKSKQFNEISAETVELQQMFYKEIKEIIEEMVTAKAETSSIIHQLSEVKGKMKDLQTENIKLKQRVSQLSFEDITEQMVEQTTRTKTVCPVTQEEKSEEEKRSDENISDQD